MCIVFLPNQTEENSSCVETRSFPCPPYHLAHTLAPDRHKAEKHPLIKAVTCCFLAPSTGSGRGWEGNTASPGGMTFTCQACSDYPARNLPFLPLVTYGICILDWGDVYRLCTCHLELPVGRDHTWLLFASPHLEQPLHRKGSNTCVKKQIK